MMKAGVTQATAAPSRIHPRTVRHTGEAEGCTSAERRASRGDIFVARRIGDPGGEQRGSHAGASPTRSAVGVTVTVVARAMKCLTDKELNYHQMGQRDAGNGPDRAAGEPDEKRLPDHHAAHELWASPHDPQHRYLSPPLLDRDGQGA